MEFIEPEEFLKQDKEVQRVLNDSIKLCIGDRIYHKLSKKCYIYLGEYNEAFWNVFDFEDKCTSVVCKDCFYRCLYEGHLRQFIEDKTNMNINLDYICPECGYGIVLTCYGRNSKPFIDLGNNILQAYWKVACEIAKEIANKN